MHGDPTRKRPNGPALNTLLVVVSTISMFLFGEAVVRGLVVLLDRPPIIMSDARAGWAGKPGLQRLTKVYGKGQFTMSTDTHGRRLSYPVEREIPKSTPIILLSGDSFVQGIAVHDEDTFAWHLARKMPDHHIVNLGVTGYATDQELVKLEEFLKPIPTWS